jgi:hypothetical protein
MIFPRITNHGHTMRDPHSRLVWCATHPVLVVSIVSAVSTVLLSSCSGDLPLRREAQQAEEGVTVSPYSIVFVIHGDGDYLYHDTSGTGYTADEEALAGAKRIALRNPRAEVFIFHQIPRKHFLFFFPLHDGEFYYYRDGRLIANELYWRDQGQSPLDPEVRLYRRFRNGIQRGAVSLFCYCGHEIPEFGGAGYDASYPDRPFTVHDLADGLQGFTRDSARIDLMVLSTCFGSTPYTIGALGSFARYIIASPDNLHLSYFDLHPLERLDLSLQGGDVSAFAHRFAQQSFDRLTQDVQTAVSVAVFDVDRVQEFLHSVQMVYDRTLTSLKGATQASMATIERCDCADLPAYAMPTMNEGVDVFYRAARFGRSKLKQNHSGWECWRERGLHAANSQPTEPALK